MHACDQERMLLTKRALEKGLRSSFLLLTQRVMNISLPQTGILQPPLLEPPVVSRFSVNQGVVLCITLCLFRLQSKVIEFGEFAWGRDGEVIINYFLDYVGKGGWGYNFSSVAGSRAGKIPMQWTTS